MVLSPIGNTGTYFGQQSREATRFQWLETWTSAPLDLYGKHTVQVGTVLAHAEDTGQVLDRNVNLVDAAGNLRQTITYSGSGAFSLADFEPAAYAQDHWIVNRNLATDTGIRIETQSLTYTTRVAPRWGFAWTPTASNAIVVRGGLGLFYDAVPLDTYAFNKYPEQTVTNYDGMGNIISGPQLYLNIISQSAESRNPFLHQQDRDGNFAPYTFAWNLETEHSVSESLALRVRYLQAVAQNQLTLSPQVAAEGAALVLSGSGEMHRRQLESRPVSAPRRNVNSSSPMCTSLPAEISRTLQPIWATFLFPWFVPRSSQVQRARSRIACSSGELPIFPGGCIFRRMSNIATASPGSPSISCKTM